MEKLSDKSGMPPAMQAAHGAALVRVGIEMGDLSMVREGKQHQAEAAAKGAKPVLVSSNNRPLR